MRRRLLGWIVASLAFALSPGAATGQCEGGAFVAGYYLPDGTYVPGHCTGDNLATPGQLYPSGGQPPSLNSGPPGVVVPAGNLAPTEVATIALPPSMPAACATTAYSMYAQADGSYLPRACLGSLGADQTLPPVAPAPPP